MSHGTRPESAEASRKVDLKAPQVSSDELSAFFQAHFSDSAASQFGSSFLEFDHQYDLDGSDEAYYDECDEEESLGYYADGVKRTLTDEQIEIFRHSELQNLLREKRKAARNSDSKRATEAEASADGFGSNENTNALSEPTLPSTFKSSKKKRKGAKRQKMEPKPDLRKRTWDVVETGLDSLNYD
ncbi:hypothetical protein N3K66_005638 [Trichothecium roseum]|uniref:Uncharacterized protein n=1 Tax=Trichothecium roseum TaxID=47278 RepID=A0ACC0V0A8_9HYPO|nr:hypothetical protein N3K66_005638 [Trichothecium roseum]